MPCWFNRILSALKVLQAQLVKRFTRIGVPLTSNSIDLVINEFVDDEVLCGWFFRFLVCSVAFVRDFAVILLSALIDERFCEIGFRLFIRGIFGRLWFRG